MNPSCIILNFLVTEILLLEHHVPVLIRAWSKTRRQTAREKAPPKKKTEGHKTKNSSSLSSYCCNRDLLSPQEPIEADCHHPDVKNYLNEPEVLNFSEG